MNKINAKHAYLRSKGWKQTHTPYCRNIMWIKDVHVENIKDAYELQQKWDKEVNIEVTNIHDESIITLSK